MAEQPSPVHRFAEEHGIPVFTPVSLKGEAEQEAFASLDLDAAARAVLEEEIDAVT